MLAASRYKGGKPLEGIVTRSAAGFYTVRDAAGEKHTCRARGKLRRFEKRSEPVVIGDRVHFNPNTKVIEAVHTRDNYLLRPPVANVDQVLLVVSIKEPQPDWALVTRQLVSAESAGITASICLNKADLVSPGARASLRHSLRAWPYRIFMTSALRGLGLAGLNKVLAGRCSVFSGPSGVGKSTLLNAMQPGLARDTAVVSDRSKRGRHTTRAAELVTLPGGGLAVDTPGFSRLGLSGLTPETLADCFPEMGIYRPQCRFRDCRHLEEPACAVRRAVEEGKIDSVRYEHYRLVLKELAQTGGRGSE